MDESTASEKVQKNMKNTTYLWKENIKKLASVIYMTIDQLTFILMIKYQV